MGIDGCGDNVVGKWWKERKKERKKRVMGEG